MTWKQLIESFLETPEDILLQSKQHRTSFACLSISFSSVILEKGLLTTISAHFIANALLLQQLPDPSSAQSSDMSLVLRYDDPETALEAALKVSSVLSKQRLKAGVALSYGEGLIVDEDWKSIEKLRAQRLSFLASLQDVSATESFIHSVQIPDGIGSFAAPLSLQKTVGFPFQILRDYR